MQPAPNYEEHLKAYTPESAARLDAAVKRAMETGEPYELDLQCRFPNKATRWITARGEVKRDADGIVLGLRGTAQNITERKAVEEEREQYFKLFNTSADVMVIADPNGAFKKVNPACTELLGYTEGELISKPFVDFIHPDDRQTTLDEMARQLKIGYSLNFENRYMCKDGSVRWLSWRAIYVAAEGTTYATARDITGRKLAEEKLYQSLNMIRHIIDSVPQSVFWKDRDWAYLGCNEVFARAAGIRKPEDIIGKTDFDLPWPREEAVAYRDDDREVIERGQPKRHIIEPLQQADGSRLWIDTTKVPLADKTGAVYGVLGVYEDVTERKRAEIALRDSEAMLQAIIDTEPECVKLLDAGGRLILMNRAGLDMLDVDLLDQVKGQCVYPLIVPEHRQAFVDLTEGVFRGESGTLAFEAVGVKGRHIWLETHAAPFRDEDGRIVALLGVTRDITGRKAMEQAIAERTAQLEDMTRNLEQRVAEEVEARRRGEQLMLKQSKLAAMGEMIGAIAHQWRQPLNSLGIIVQKMREDFKDGSLDEAAIDKTVRRSMEQIHFMSRTIDDFRDFFRPSKEKTRFDVKVALGEVLSLLSAQLWNNNITYTVRCGVHGKAFNDPHHIESCREAEVETYLNDFKQVALNIINNAKDAILERRRQAGDQAEGLIDIRFSRANGSVVLSIADNGGGIPEGIMDRIFEPYYTTKSPDKGTGIGLYMAKVIIENNIGGRLSAKNNAEGAEFTIEVQSA